MKIISPCTKIKDLSPIDTSQTVCLDNYSVFVATDNSLATVGKRVYELEIGDLLVVSKREICFFDGDSTVGFSFNTEGKLPFGVMKPPTSAAGLVEAISLTEGSMLYPLLELLLCQLNTATIKDPLINKETQLLSETVLLMHRSLNTRISVAELSDAAKVSLSNIKRLFAKYVGIGAHDYFNLLKINKAKELLINGETVTATAEKTGFANQAYFSAAFKRIAGISPKDFAIKLANNAPSVLKTATVGTSKAKTQSTHKTASERQQSKRQDLPDYLL